MTALVCLAIAAQLASPCRLLAAGLLAVDSDAATATAAAHDTQALGAAECLSVGCSADTEAVAHIAIGWLRTDVCSSVVDSAVVAAADAVGWSGAARAEKVGCSTDDGEVAVVAIGWLQTAAWSAVVDSAVAIAAEVGGHRGAAECLTDAAAAAAAGGDTAVAAAHNAGSFGAPECLTVSYSTDSEAAVDVAAPWASLAVPAANAVPFAAHSEAIDQNQQRWP